MEQIDKSLFNFLVKNRASAKAKILGGATYPNISGFVEFYALENGTVVLCDIENLPETDTNIFAIHIHEGNSCDGEKFALSGGHYNPKNLLHPKHAGDMPPLFAFDGEAFSVFYTERFTVSEIIGRVVIVHSMPDDFTSQPSGNSGEKIACGVIKR